uniref:PH domain-containing protein n=1 Tax=Panagrellus redivivus TaxID=6233 RepID=A0A7E4VZQ4_PANRE
MKKCIDDDESSFISDPLFQRLFRLFLLFAEPADPPPPSGTATTTKNRALQHISSAQAHFLVNELFRLVRPRCSAPLHIPQQPDRVTFRELIELCDLVFPDRKQLEPCVDRIFDRYVSQIVNKGFVMCRKIPSRMNCSFRRSPRPWKSYWCTIVPGTVFLWPLHKKTTVPNRQEIVLDANSMVHMGTFEEDRFTWQLYTSKHKYQFGHFDEIQRQHWFSDMNLVIEYRSKSDLFNFDREFSRRNENIGKEKDCSWKLALESENQRLTQLLNEERQALYDEEIVRELATRMLDEERDRSEQFEKQVVELETQLIHERNTCAELRDRLNSVTGDKPDDDISCKMQEQLNFGSCTPSSVYLDEYEACNEDSPTPQPTQLDYLIISTQSI